ncbi:DNA polymerase III PolC-type [Mycobacterium talmoniae]|uniref:DNA polymerase III PolC-type n=1 Tax=Mycobacterium talmoniae TaxID=1858794 RepID=A0A2S8BBL3_9MYCO|nr:DNA polymerase III PolC-type [Mycobacterium talmoniae]
MSFAELDPERRARVRDPAALHDVLVVDLETDRRPRVGTPRAAAGLDAITEIGAVKVRGGTVLGEFATLIDPQRSIPPQITRLTGITTAMVCDAPTIAAVLPTFLEFARDSVLVAHNAGFDVGFLRAATERCGLAWPKPPVLCTVRLARRVLSARKPPACGWPSWPGCSGSPPSPPTAPWTTRAPPSRCCTR